MKVTRALASAVALAMVSSLALIAPASATVKGEGEGCTPGFWKNHTSWKSYDDNTDPDSDDFLPTTNIEKALDVDVPDAYGSLQTWTAMQALQGKGGSDLYGAGQILLRAAVASYLNADADVKFPLSRYGAGYNGEPSMQSQIQAALDSQDRATILAYATYLDGLNNAGCPLS